MTRALPLPDDETAFFWRSGADGVLRILRCNACATYIHPPRAACPSCASADVAPREVSGRGVVHSFTVTHRALPGFDPPFTVAMVELVEQQGLRVISNLFGIAPDGVRIGMPVRVRFENVGDDVWLPLFEPEAP